MRPLVLLAVAVALVGALVLSLRPARADGRWLDDPTFVWNQPNMVIPAAPVSGEPPDPRCAADNRSDESPEEQALVEAGWTVFGSYTGGWDVRIVRGLAGYDGMCRPMAYQAFVFVGGKLAGTLSPEPMYSRFDGALVSFDLYQADMIVAQYVRYTDQDPLCCPSAQATTMFRIDSTQGTPVVVRLSTTTEPALPAQPAQPSEPAPS